MQQRVRKRYRGKIPSSSGQLPVPVALNAELPTLFGLIIHDFTGFVNIFFPEFQLNSKLGVIVQPMPSPLGRVARRAGRGAELALFLLAFRRKPTAYTPLPASNSPVYGRIRSHLPQRGRHCACGAEENDKLKFEVSNR